MGLKKGERGEQKETKTANLEQTSQSDESTGTKRGETGYHECRA